MAPKRYQTIPLIEEKLQTHNLEFVGNITKDYKNKSTPFQVRYPDGIIRNLTWQRLREDKIYKGDPNEEKKHTIEDVQQLCEKFELTCISDEYVNNKEKLCFICHYCDCYYYASFNILYKRTEKGCGACVRNPWPDIIKIFEDSNCSLLSDATEYRNRNSPLEFICSCNRGNGITSLRSFCKGVRCSLCTLDKRENTCMKKYETNNVFSSEHGKKKIKEYYMKWHNVAHSSQVPEIKEKKKLSCLKHFGYEYGFCQPYVYEKIKNIFIEKYETPYYLHSPQFKEKMIELYDVEHSLQNKEIFEKWLKSNYAVKKYKFPSGRNVLVQGYEPFALNDLVKKYEEDDIFVALDEIPIIKYEYENRPRRYYPDILIKSLGLVIEVKSEYTYDCNIVRNKLKAIAVLKEGLKYQIHVYNKKKKRVKFVEYTLKKNELLISEINILVKY
jgi:hypothetical protein